MPPKKIPKKRVSKFEKNVLEIVKDKNISYIDAVLVYCESNEIDPTHVKNIITENIKNKLEEEFGSLNMLLK